MTEGFVNESVWCSPPPPESPHLRWTHVLRQLGLGARDICASSTPGAVLPANAWNFARNETFTNHAFMTHHHFKAPWGRTLLVASTFTTLLLVGVTFGMAAGWRHLRLLTMPSALPAAMPLLILAGALPFTIRGYVITKDGILIRRLWWNTVLRFEDIRSVEAKPLALGGSLRTWGNGGLYSFTGCYWSSQLGHFRAYVTDLNRTVVVHMKKRTAVLSPDDPEAFARIISTRINAS